MISNDFRHAPDPVTPRTAGDRTAAQGRPHGRFTQLVKEARTKIKSRFTSKAKAPVGKSATAGTPTRLETAGHTGDKNKESTAWRTSRSKSRLPESSPDESSTTEASSADFPALPMPTSDRSKTESGLTHELDKVYRSHKSAFAAHTNGNNKNAKAALTYSVASNTVFNHLGSLKAASTHASKLAKQAQLPRKTPESSEYKALRRQWNAALEKDIKLLATLQAFDLDPEVRFEPDQSLAELAARVTAYRKELPDMNPAAFARLASEALACDLPAEHLKPMLLAAVPIHANLKPDEATTQLFATATHKETQTLSGGQSGSPVQLVTLTLADSTQKKVVTKQLNSSPFVTPTAHTQSGIEFPLEGIAMEFQKAVESQLDSGMTDQQKSEAQASLTAAFHEALLKGSDRMTWEPQISSLPNLKKVYHAKLPAREQMPNLYGRDLAMRQLARFLNQKDLVAPVSVAVVDGVYCEVSDYNPNLGQQVLTASGPARLPLDTADLRKAVGDMSQDSLNRLGWPYGFDRVERAEDGQSLLFHPKESGGAVPGRVFMNRVLPDDAKVREHHADHHTKDFLANEQDNHSGNYSQQASWDHDASFGVQSHYSAQPPKVIRKAMLETLRNDKAWNNFTVGLAGLISPAEIEAMSARRSRLLEAQSLAVANDGWTSPDVTVAMELGVVQDFRRTYDTESKVDETKAFNTWSGNEKNFGGRHVVPLATHVYEWEYALIDMARSNKAGKPPTTAVFHEHNIRMQLMAQASSSSSSGPVQP